MEKYFSNKCWTFQYKSSPQPLPPCFGAAHFHSELSPPHRPTSFHEAHFQPQTSPQHLPRIFGQGASNVGVARSRLCARGPEKIGGVVTVHPPSFLIIGLHILAFGILEPRKPDHLKTGGGGGNLHKVPGLASREDSVHILGNTVYFQQHNHNQA